MYLVPSSYLLLVAMPGAPSSVLILLSRASVNHKQLKFAQSWQKSRAGYSSFEQNSSMLSKLQSFTTLTYQLINANYIPNQLCLLYMAWMSTKASWHLAQHNGPCKTSCSHTKNRIQPFLPGALVALASSMDLALPQSVFAPRCCSSKAASKGLYLYFEQSIPRALNINS